MSSWFYSEWRGSNFSKHDRCCEKDIRHHAKVAYGSMLSKKGLEELSEQ